MSTLYSGVSQHRYHQLCVWRCPKWYKLCISTACFAVTFKFLIINWSLILQIIQFRKVSCSLWKCSKWWEQMFLWECICCSVSCLKSVFYSPCGTQGCFTLLDMLALGWQFLMLGHIPSALHVTSSVVTQTRGSWVQTPCMVTPEGSRVLLTWIMHNHLSSYE
jgi:hypothetical protein